MPLPDFVDCRVDDQLQHERCKDATDHRCGDPLHDVRTGSGGPHDGHEPHEHHGHGHEFRANPLHGSVHDGVTKIRCGSQTTFTACILVRDIEIEQHEDAGFRIDPHQRDQADPDADTHVVPEQI